MKYKVYLDELDKKCDELLNCSKNNINEKINELSHAFDGVIWQGIYYDTYLNGYNKEINKLKKINRNFELFARFLKETHVNYSDTNEKLSKSWEEFLSELKGDNDEL
jgi:transposase-like protein